MSSSYLVPGTGADGTQLWVVTVNDDGTSTASELVDFYPGAGGSAFAPMGSPVQNPGFTAVDGGFLFVAAGLANETPGDPAYGSIDPAGSQTGRELWFTDGTAAGTHLVYDVFQGTQSVYDPVTYQNVNVGNDGIGTAPQIVALGGTTALFVAQTSGNGYGYLFTTDTTSGGTYQLSTDRLFNPTELTQVNGRGLFTASVTPAGGSPTSYLFSSDGTAAGTAKLTSLANVASFTMMETAAGGQRALFTGDGGQLWVTDGATVSQLTTAGGVSGLQPVLDLGGGHALFFEVVGSSTQLWVTDGTAAGTTALNSAVGSDQSKIGSTGTFVSASGKTEAFFESYLPSGTPSQPALWVSDGTAGGTRQIASWTDTAGGTAVLGAKLAFTTANANGDIGLSVTDGTASGTTQLVTSGVGNLRSGPTGHAVFSEIDPSSGATTLFITDGTVAGTQAITGAGLSYFGNYTADGGNLLFTAMDTSGSYGLWSVGTSGGAVQLNLSGDSAPSQLATLGNEVFFTASTAGGVKEAWVTNGTQGGTHRVQGGGAIVVGSGSGTNFNSSVLPCFLAGTRLRTPQGDIAVEALREGDLVLTGSGAAVPIIWIGQRDVDLRRHPAPERVCPVRIAAHAFGPGLPARDLILSPDHAIFIDGALIPVAHLIDGVSIVQERPDRAHYFHVELPRHDIVLAEGLATESFLDTGNRGAFDGGGGATTLHPDFWALHWDNACAPLVLTGPRIAAARAMLRARAELQVAA